MENASKALIIAEAILLAILVISLGVNVFKDMSDTVEEEVSMDEQQMASFNAKLSPYIGSNISSSQVNELIQIVRTIDQNALKGIDNFVWVDITSNTNGALVWKSGKTVQSKNVASGQYYTVEATYTNGLYRSIKVK